MMLNILKKGPTTLNSRLSSSSSRIGIPYKDDTMKILVVAYSTRKFPTYLVSSYDISWKGRIAVPGYYVRKIFIEKFDISRLVLFCACYENFINGELVKKHTKSITLSWYASSNKLFT